MNYSSVSSVEQTCQKASDTAKTLKLLASHHRLGILYFLLQSDCTLKELSDFMDLPPSALNNHLTRLRGAGLIAQTRFHRIIQYRLTDNPINSVVKMLYAHDFPTL